MPGLVNPPKNPQQRQRAEMAEKVRMADHHHHHHLSKSSISSYDWSMHRSCHANLSILSILYPSRYLSFQSQNFRNHFPDLQHLQYKGHFYIPCTSGLGAGYSAYLRSFYGSCTRESQNFQLSDVMSSGSYSFQMPEGENHLFKDWHEQRQHKLTASTFATATGFWRGRRTQLWLEKIGAIRPFTCNASTLWSNSQKPVALERYGWISGNTILIPGIQEYNEDWLAASADGIVEHVAYGLPYDGILEIKCPFFDGKAAQAFPWSKIPVHYVPQAQGLMEILDKEWMDLYCWTPNGSSLFRLHRNRQYWHFLKNALSDFWWNHVQPAKEVCSMYPIEDPIWELSLLRPAPKHECFRDIVYASKLLASSSKLLLREIHGKLMY